MSPVDARKLYIGLEVIIRNNDDAIYADTMRLGIPNAPRTSLAHGTKPSTAEIWKYWEKIGSCMQEWAALLDQELPK